MTRRSEIVNNFREPRRQSYFAIVLIIYKFYKVIIRQAWPFLIFILLGSRKSNRAGWEDYMLYIGILFGLISMLLAILNYFKHYYYIKDDELHVSKGVLKKQKISIPLERVQTVNFEENLFHRIFKVTSIKIDTAGSKEKEFDLDAISLSDAAEIRDYILGRKKEQIPFNQDFLIDPEESVTESEKEEVIAQLSLGDLFKIGVSYNHLKSAGIIVGAIFWLLSQLDDAMPDLMDTDTVTETMIGTGLFLGLVIMLFFIFISFLFSMVRSVLKYYDLNFKRRGDGFKIISGLFTRQEFSALDNKIQQVGWKDNLLQKHLFGIHDFTLKQAGSITINSKKSIYIPGVDARQIKNIVAYHFDNLDLSLFDFNAVDIKMLYRWWLYLSIIFVPIAISAFVQSPYLGVLTIFIYLFFGYSQRRKYYKTQYGISQEVLYLKGGTYGDETSLIKLHKIQALEIKQSPYQKRHRLANLKIYTASGSNQIPYIGIDRASELADLFLYKIESSKKSWM